MARSDYAHWNEEQDAMWWAEEGRFEGTEHDRSFCDICMSYHEGPCPDDYYDEEEEEDGEGL